MALVSIIIPIYNAGSRLHRLFDSLLEQSVQDLNFICVIDCPTDGSDKVCYEYARKDARVIPILNIQNLGISASRNRGLEEAYKRGSKYIGFADHDDYVSPCAYKMLIEEMLGNESLDVVFGDSVIENENGIKKKIVFRKPIWDGILESLLLPMNSTKNPNLLVRSVWNSLYRADFLRDNGIKFYDRNMYFEEDTLFNLQVYALTKKIKYINEVVYYWNKHSNATSEKFDSREIEARKILNFLEQEWNILKKYDLLKFCKYFHVMLSWFMRRYYSTIVLQNDVFKKDLGTLMRSSNYPLLGEYENMKIVSKIRFKLFILTIKLRLKYN